MDQSYKNDINQVGRLIDANEALKILYKLLMESAINNVGCNCKADEIFADIAENRIKTWLDLVPTADNWEKYSEKLYQIAYTRGMEAKK